MYRKVVLSYCFSVFQDQRLNVRFYKFHCFCFRKSIAPGEEIRETVQMKPRRLGRKEIIASFHSKQICDITGVTEVDVTEENRN